MAVGLRLAAAMMHNLTHHSMKLRIKYRHGLFRPYCGTDDDALEGTGQGSGGSPGIWLIYSVTLLAAFCCFSPGMKLLSPYDTLLIVSILDSYRVSPTGSLDSWSTDCSLGKLERRILLSTKARACTITPHGGLLFGERYSSFGLQDDGLPCFRISVDSHAVHPRTV
jgi:hypothetical protein